MLQKQTVSLSFAQGLDTKTDPKQVVPGKLLTLENGVFTQGQSIIKRKGYTALPVSIYNTVNSITSGNSIGLFMDDLVMSDGAQFYSYSATTQSWVNTGNRQSCSIMSEPVSSLAGPSFQVAKHSSGVELYVYVTSSPISGNSGGLTYVYYDSLTHNVLYRGGIAGINTVNIFPFVSGSNFVVFFSDATAHNIRYFTLPVSAPISNPTVTALITAHATNYNCDVIQVGTDYYIAYNDSTNSYPHIARYNSSFTLVTDITVVSTANTAIRLASDTYNSRIAIGYITSANAIFAEYTLALVSAVASTNIVVNNGTNTVSNLSIIVYSATQALIYVDRVVYNTVSPIKSVARYGINLGTLAVSTFGVAVSTSIYSKPFVDSLNYIYITVAVLDPLQKTIYVIRDIPGSANFTNGENYVITKFSYGTGPTALGLANAISVLSLGSDKFLIPYQKAVDSSLVNGSVQSYFNAERLTLTLNTKTRYTALASNLLMSGGLLTTYDGKGTFENGFHLFPNPLGFSQFSTGGNIADGAYSYSFLYEFIDNQGNRHRSAPTPGQPVVVAAGTGTAAVGITIPGLGLTDYYKGAATVLKIYRTQKDGTIYYLVGQANNSIGNRISFTDTLADASLAGNEQLYTTGGEVENLTPPASDIMVSFKNRLIVVDAEDPLTWWYSKQVTPGFPVEFSDLFTQGIDQRGGNITAVAVLDDKLIFFKPNTFFYVIGDGPAPSGVNNDFSYPQSVITDVGCSNPDSIAVIPSGILFQSSKGIYLLDRGLGVTYIGAPAEAYNSATITSAHLVPNTTQVRFTLSSPANTILVYDYLYNQWSTFTGLGAIDSTVYNNQYTLLTSAGLSLLETSGVYTDNGAAISLKIKTSWLSLAQLQGFQRVRRFELLGDAKSATILTLNMAYDFDSTVVQTDTITVAGTEVPLQYRIHLARQKCESVQITLFDTPTLPYGEGLSLSALGFEVGVKQGLNKMSAAKSYG